MDPYEEYNEVFYDGYERCPRHGCIISNGMFDAPCGGCEAEMDEADERWQFDPENPFRSHCGSDRETWWMIVEPSFSKTCNDPLSSPDDIPF